MATTGLSLMVGIVWFFISESPRWLIVTGKIKEAKDVIEVASKKNKFDAINESNEDKNINPDDIENYNDNRSESTFNTMFPPSDEENYGTKDVTHAVASPCSLHCVASFWIALLWSYFSFGED